MNRLILLVEDAPMRPGSAETRRFAQIVPGVETNRLDGTVTLSPECSTAAEVVECADEMIRDLERIKEAARRRLP